MKFKKLVTGIIASTILATSLVGCGTKDEEIKGNTIDPNITIEQITKLAKEEGEVVSIGMPDSWANWKDTWNDLNKKYGLKHSDTDLSSAEEIAKLEAEKKNPTADIGDVGWSYGPVAKERGLTLPYKTSHWDSVPDWAKDEEGNWMLAYTGTMAILANKELVDNPPKSFQDILEGDYNVCVDDVTTGTQSQMAVLAAAMAFGGDENNIQPGLDFFAELAKQGRLLTGKNDLASIENGEVDVTLIWDFNALAYRDKIDRDRFYVAIPSDASVRTGYTTIINKYAQHPYSAMLAREYIFSDEGQINLAKGYAKPVREDVELPADVQAMLLPNEQYKNVKEIKDFEGWSKTVENIGRLWQEQVLVYMK
ncbi:ABC transporter substrate-binding protein [Tepidibacter aestuarii]|uniref:ABC transporter substrate-binding protein n=1 Tax=Tepidibacter aestuarii TaxID=2925782 RepID=UPI0020BEC108|nr:ABC transporter substrate-binding protein [Tepidibacter aestuarii]CAH2214580.1 ABC transporter substrate-binding protein [Tepidibacter aestuarii]